MHIRGEVTQGAPLVSLRGGRGNGGENGLFDAGVSYFIDMSLDAYMPTSRAFSPLRTGKSTLMHPIGSPDPLGVRLVLKWEGRIGRRRGDGGIRVSANASREGSRVPGRDDGVCLSAS